MESDMAMYAINRYCDLAIVGGVLNSYGMGFAVQ